MSSSTSAYNARRGYATGEAQQHQYSQGKLGSGLRRSHLYGNRGTTSGFGGGTKEDPTANQASTYSRLDVSRPGLSGLPRPDITGQSSTLPTASEYFAQEAAETAAPKGLSPAVPWSRAGTRFTHKIQGITSTSSYGLPPTPESDVSVSRVITPPKNHRDHQFNVDMMQRMTQHAKISPLNQYSSLKKELKEDNLVVDDTNVDRLVARAEGRVGGTNRAYEPTSVDNVPSRRVAFRSPEAVEGAKEASRRLNGASTIERPGSMYEAESKPAEPNSTSNMYAELRRTLSESSSEKPKRVVLPAISKRQLPPLSSVNRRHVEIRPRRPVGASSLLDPPSPSPQRNNYYPPATRPRTAPAQEEPTANIDWLAAAQGDGDDGDGDLSQKPVSRRRPRTLSSGTPLRSARSSEQFGGELQKDQTDIRPSTTATRPPGGSKTAPAESTLPPTNKLPSALSNSYMQHELVDFVSEEDLSFDRSRENKPSTTSRSTPAATSRRSVATAVSKSQDTSFLRSTKQTDPDETLDTLRQLSRLLSGNTPNKKDSQSPLQSVVSKPGGKPVEVIPVAKTPATVDTRQPYKHQARPLSTKKPNPQSTTQNRLNLEPKRVDPERYKDVGLASILSNVQSGLRSTAPSTSFDLFPPTTTTSTNPTKTTHTAQKPSSTKKPRSSQAIQFEDGYETDDSLDRLLTNETDYASLLKPAVFEDESFLHGTVQVAEPSKSSITHDFETLALRTKVLANLQTVQLDIRETRKGLEDIERKFGILEDEGLFSKPSNTESQKPSLPDPSNAMPPQRVFMLARRKQRPAGKGLFRRPWVFKDYFFAFLFLFLTLLAIEYKLWSDTIIPQYSKVSSDEWFAKHPVGAYRPGGTFRAMFQVLVWAGQILLFVLEKALAVFLWVLAGVQWVEVRVMDAISPIPPEFEYLKTGFPNASTTTTASITSVTNMETATIQARETIQAIQTTVSDSAAETFLPL